MASCSRSGAGTRPSAAGRPDRTPSPGIPTASWLLGGANAAVGLSSAFGTAPRVTTGAARASLMLIEETDRWSSLRLLRQHEASTLGNSVTPIEAASTSVTVTVAIGFAHASVSPPSFAARRWSRPRGTARVGHRPSRVSRSTSAVVIASPAAITWLAIAEPCLKAIRYSRHQFAARRPLGNPRRVLVDFHNR